MGSNISADDARVLLGALRAEIAGSPGEPLPEGWTAADDVDLATRLMEIAGVEGDAPEQWTRATPNAVRLVVERKGAERDRMIQRAGGVAEVMRRAGGRVVDQDANLGTLWRIPWQGGACSQYLDESHIGTEQRCETTMPVLSDVPACIRNVRQAVAFTGGASAHTVLREL